MTVYAIEATYTVRKQLEVRVEEGDPKDPRNWSEVLWEQDQDCYLSDVLSVTESEDR